MTAKLQVSPQCHPSTNGPSRTPRNAHTYGQTTVSKLLGSAPLRTLRSTPAAAISTRTARHQPDVQILLLVHPPWQTRKLFGWASWPADRPSHPPFRTTPRRFSLPEATATAPATVAASTSHYEERRRPRLRYSNNRASKAPAIQSTRLTGRRWSPPTPRA
jgi:hypothetical protein